mmetsp:Transcript_50436/g.153376  ORF Transcript_50436/g.153376 Transcript_50436/m.153376 type:complete len:84 (+) Transcript_50436:346-597(+)
MYYKHRSRLYTKWGHKSGGLEQVAPEDKMMNAWATITNPTVVILPHVLHNFKALRLQLFFQNVVIDTRIVAFILVVIPFVSLN